MVSIYKRKKNQREKTKLKFWETHGQYEIHVKSYFYIKNYFIYFLVLEFNKYEITRWKKVMKRESCWLATLRS
jgi:hypothetical protein